MNKTEQRILDWINRIRSQYNADVITELVGGVPQDSNSCVIAENLNDYAHLLEVEVIPNVEQVGRTWKVKWDDDVKWGTFVIEDFDGNLHSGFLPKYVAVFANSFDMGRYPHLTSEESGIFQDW